VWDRRQVSAALFVVSPLVASAEPFPPWASYLLAALGGAAALGALVAAYLYCYARRLFSRVQHDSEDHERHVAAMLAHQKALAGHTARDDAPSRGGSGGSGDLEEGPGGEVIGLVDREGRVIPIRASPISTFKGLTSPKAPAPPRPAPPRPAPPRPAPPSGAR
jgi:hypothetical protein